MAAHTNSQERVRACESGPRELRHFDGSVITLLGHDIDWFRNVLADNGCGCSINEVFAQNLRHEREGPGCAQVALDDLELGGLARLFGWLADNLHVVRARYLERCSHLLCDVLQAEHFVVSEGEGRQHQRGIAGMNSRILDVLGNGVQEETALVGDSIDVDLLGIVDELRDNDWVQRGD